MNKDKKDLEVGEKVISLTTNESDMSQKRKAGRIYEVKGVRFCPQCGIQYVNIGGYSHIPLSKCECGTLVDLGEMAYTYARHFIRPEEIPAKLQEAVDREDYPTAILLRDIKL